MQARRISSRIAPAQASMDARGQRLPSYWRAQMFRTRAIVLLLAVPTLAVLTAGCDDEEKATPQVIFEGETQRGTGNDCTDASPLFKVGDFGNQSRTPVLPSRAIADGQPNGGTDITDNNTVSVSCSVTPAGADEFDVSGSVALVGAGGGLFEIKGKFKTGGEQTGVDATFSSRRTGNKYVQKGGCIVRYTTQFMGVAAGRVWGDLTCPRGENESAQKQCQMIAQFRFENCAQ
jgi:hypothetical protein